MKINLAKSAGFCSGVKRAIKIALQTASSRKKVYILGDIVHNEEVVSQIEKAGIQKIRALSCGEGKTLLIRAHGSVQETFRKALASGYEIIDATCPMVKEIHRIARSMEEDGYRIIIIGDKRHDEVRGISGQLRQKAIIIEGIKDIQLKKIKGVKKAAVVVQSTQELNKVIKIIGALKKNLKDLRFFNTICRPTREKQEEIKAMAKANQAMVIIGSKTSANTKRLYQIAKSLNRNTYWVSSKGDIRAGWFKNKGRIGVTAGASTPDSTTQDIIKYLKQIRNYP